MVIYGEYLFAENFITGFLILYFTEKIIGENLDIPRLIVGAILCGICGFTIFISVNLIMSLILKLLIALIISTVSFRWKSLKRMFVDGVLFIIITCLYGGITIGILNIFDRNQVESIYYLSPITYMTVTASATAAALLVALAVSLIKTKRSEMRNTVDVCIYAEGKKLYLPGYIDTGNFLKEPISGRPVSIISEEVMKGLLEGMDDKESRYAVIPYTSIGASKGTLTGYRIDYLTIRGKTYEKHFLAVCNKFEKELGKNAILLNGELMERGIYDDWGEDKACSSENKRRCR